MANNAYDDLFDQWGQALNVNPQLAKSVCHVESNCNEKVADGPESPNAPIDPATGKRERAQGPMQIMPSTARALAAKLGMDPNQINLHDMRWAVPIGMAYLAEGMTATNGDTVGALSYYHGGPDQSKWGPKTQDYVKKATSLYPDMTLTPQRPPDTGPAEPPPGSGPAISSAWLRAHGQTMDPTKLNWCGAYTNAALHAAGIEGLPTGPGLVATNWGGYGAPVTGQVLPNDVLVMPNGRAMGQTGGHVGVATGGVRVGPGGQLQYEMKSGNAHNGIVSVDWVPASQVVARRGQVMQAQPAEPEVAQPPDTAPAPAAAPPPAAPASPIAAPKF